MQEQDKQQFEVIWEQAASLYGKVPSEAAMDLTFNALSGLSIEEVRGGLNAHVRDPVDGRFLPKPADIIRQVRGTAQDTALAAWSAVEQAMRLVGSFDSVVFERPETMQAISDMGGWIRLCETTDKKLPFVQNEFVKRFSHLASHPIHQFPGKLVGIAEASNRINYPDEIEPPKLIGNPDQCAKVLSHGQQRSLSITTLDPAKLGNDSSTAQSINDFTNSLLMKHSTKQEGIK